MEKKSLIDLIGKHKFREFPKDYLFVTNGEHFFALKDAVFLGHPFSRYSYCIGDLITVRKNGFYKILVFDCKLCYEFMIKNIWSFVEINNKVV